MDTQIKVGVLIRDGDKVLLIKEWSNNKNAYLWNIVKGTFDSSLDKTLVDCATREAQEEAGVKVELSNFLSLSVKHGHSIRVYVNFVGKIVEGEPTLTPKDEQDKRDEDIKEVVLSQVQILQPNVVSVWSINSTQKIKWQETGLEKLNLYFTKARLREFIFALRDISSFSAIPRALW